MEGPAYQRGPECPIPPGGERGSERRASEHRVSELIHSTEGQRAANVLETPGDQAIESEEKRARLTLRDSDLLGGLPEDEIEALYGSSAIESASRAQVLFQEDSTLSHLYVVSSGSVKLVRHSEEGREFIVDLAGRGDAFGTLTEPATAAVEARALEDTTLLAVPVTAVRRALERNPAFALRAVREAERRLRAAEIRAARFAFESVPRRLATLLLEASDGRSGLLRFPLNQSELASLVGSSRETVCSILNQLRRDRIVETPRGRIQVLDRRRLEGASS
jgi:CRP-like cAMP-binding protein